MSDEDKARRIDELVKKAQNARRKDANQEAADAVREALNIDPNHEVAQKLLEGLLLSGGEPIDILKLCQDCHAGMFDHEAFLGRLQKSAIDIEGTREAFEFAFEHKGERADRMVDALLNKPNGKLALVPILLKDPTRTFKALWDLGHHSLMAVITKVLLQAGPWLQQSAREKAERDMLLLLLARLLQAGLEKPEWAMRAIALMLAANAPKLWHCIDSDAYVVFFEALNLSNSPALRSQATVALTKLYEVDAERWESTLQTYVEKMAMTQWTEKFICACSAVSALFPVAAQVCSKLFLKEGFVQQLVHRVSDTKSTAFMEAALELFSVACIDPTCKKRIQKYCREWLDQLSRKENAELDQYADNKDGRQMLQKYGQTEKDKKAFDERAKNHQNELAVTAALIISKLRDDGQQAGGPGDDLVIQLKQVFTDSYASSAIYPRAVESLAYQSVHARVKEDLVNDPDFLQKFISYLAKPEHASHVPVIYMGLILCQNLTKYPPVTSEEQQKIVELKAYANRTPIQRTHPLDMEEVVSARCKKLLDAGIGRVLVEAEKSASLRLHEIMSSIAMAISKHPRHRGQMVQDGLFDVAFLEARIIETDEPSTTIAKRQGCLTVARIMISLDPHLLMKKHDVKAVIRVLRYLLGPTTCEPDSESDARWWNGFPIVSAAQALTNLATYQASPSNPFYSAQNIVAECWDLLEDLWTSNAVEIRTAVTECFNNLVGYEAAIDKFVVDGERSQLRMQILAGYWSDDRGKLAVAAGGAIAQLASCDNRAMMLFLNTASGVRTTAEMMQSEKPELVHRAVVIVRQLLEILEAAKQKGESEFANRIIEKLKDARIMDTLKAKEGSGAPWDGEVDASLKILRKYEGA